jgi:hypothetical protein
MKKQASNSARNWVFWFHLLITLLAWLGPFLFSWFWIVSGYLIVVLQFIVFKRCLLNAKHDLDISEDTTFYSHLLESIGFKIDRTRLKLFVRRYLYLLLAILTLVWQLILNHEPLLF